MRPLGPYLCGLEPQLIKLEFIIYLPKLKVFCLTPTHLTRFGPCIPHNAHKSSMLHNYCPCYRLFTCIISHKSLKELNLYFNIMNVKLCLLNQEMPLKPTISRKNSTIYIDPNIINTNINNSDNTIVTTIDNNNSCITTNPTLSSTISTNSANSTDNSIDSTGTTISTNSAAISTTLLLRSSPYQLLAAAGRSIPAAGRSFFFIARSVLFLMIMVLLLTIA